MPCEYCDANVDGGCRGVFSASDCLREQLQNSQAEVQIAVSALFAFTQTRWFANTQEKSDDVRRAVEFVKKHDPELWAAYMVEDHPF